MARRHVRPLTSGLTHRWTFQGTRANLSGETVDEVGAVNGTITRGTDGNWVKIMVVTDFHLDNVDSATQFRTQAVARAGIVGQKAADVGADLILVLGDSVEDPDRIPPAGGADNDLAELHAALTDPGVSAAYVFGNHDCWTDEANRRKADFLTIVGGATEGAGTQDAYQLVDIGAGLRILILDSCFGESGGGGALVSYDKGGYTDDSGGYTSPDVNNHVPAVTDQVAPEDYTDQVTWLTNAVAAATAATRRVLIASHFPLKSSLSTAIIQNAAALIGILEAEGTATIACLASHLHTSEFAEANGISYITFDAAVENPASSFSYGLLTVNDLTGEWGLTAYGHQQPYDSAPAYLTKYGLTMDGGTSEIYVDMTSDVIVTSNDAAPADQFSVAAWIIIEGVNTNRRAVWETEPQFTSFSEVNIAPDAGKISVGVEADDATFSRAVEGSASAQDVWHHVVAANNDGTIKLYVDGVLEDTDATIAGKTLIAAAGFHIGTFRSANARFYNGKINRIEVYDHELSLLEVQSLFSQGGRTGVMIA